jgi:hypothetical protein
MTLESQKDYNNRTILSVSVASKGMKRVRGMPRLHPLDPATALGLASNLVIHLKQRYTPSIPKYLLSLTFYTNFDHSSY